MNIEEGDKCPYCNGVMHYETVKNYSCHINPPCDACIENPLICNECGWQEGDTIETWHDRPSLL
jgi:hypothetical protein